MPVAARSSVCQHAYRDRPSVRTILGSSVARKPPRAGPRSRREEEPRSRVGLASWVPSVLSCCATLLGLSHRQLALAVLPRHRLGRARTISAPSVLAGYVKARELCPASAGKRKRCRRLGPPMRLASQLRVRLERAFESFERILDADRALMVRAALRLDMQNSSQQRRRNSAPPPRKPRGGPSALAG